MEGLNGDKLLQAGTIRGWSNVAKGLRTLKKQRGDGVYPVVYEIGRDLYRLEMWQAREYLLLVPLTIAKKVEARGPFTKVELEKAKLNAGVRPERTSVAKLEQEDTLEWPSWRWEPMATAPRNKDIRARDKTGRVYDFLIHYADGGGEEQPPYRGWFIPVTNGEKVLYYDQVDPVSWQPAETA